MKIYFVLFFFLTFFGLCASHIFLLKCPNGVRIPAYLVLNKYDDCGANGYGSQAVDEDRNASLQCGTTNETVLTNNVCNGVMDCSDGSDEFECGKKLFMILL